MRHVILSILFMAALAAVAASWPLRDIAAYQCEAHGRLCVLVKYQDGPTAQKPAPFPCPDACAGGAYTQKFSEKTAEDRPRGKNFGGQGVGE